MPSEHSGMDEFDKAEEANGIHLSTNKFGAIFKMKPGVVPNGDCVETESVTNVGTHVTIIAKKSKPKGGNGKMPVSKRKRNPVGTLPKKQYVKLAPKASANEQTSVNREAASGEMISKSIAAVVSAAAASVRSDLVQDSTKSSNFTVAEPVAAQVESDQLLNKLPPALVPSVAEPSLDVVARQINSRVLPPFSPTYRPPDRFKIPIPAEGYRCQDCLDRFLLPDSLDDHLRRRSVFISFDCVTCHQLLTFYNRCSLMEHVRGHIEQGETMAMDTRLATVAPLPHELVPVVQECSARTWEKAVMGFLHGSGSARVPSSDGERPVATTVAKESTELATRLTIVTAPSANQPLVTVPAPNESRSKNLAGDQPLQYQCSECPEKFSNALSFRRHFSGSQGDAASLTSSSPMDASLQCRSCSMICTTLCSLSAHRRSHQQRRPYVCPECGQQIANTWAAFQRHVTFTCYHPSRTIGFECPSCAALSPTPERLRAHLDMRHDTESFVKCMACPMAFKNQDAFRSHRQEVHASEPGVRCGVIFKCPLCEVVFQKEGALRDHLDGHFKQMLPLRMAKYLFRCPECGELYRSKLLVSRHVNEVHPELIITCAKARATKASKASVGSGQVAETPSNATSTTSVKHLENVCRRRTDKPLTPKKVGVGRRGRKKNSETRVTDPGALTENGDRNSSSEMPETRGEDESWLTEQGNDPTQVNGKVIEVNRRRRPGSRKKFECDKCGCSFRTKTWAKVHHQRCRGSLTMQTTCAVCHEEIANPHDMAVHGHDHLKDGTLVCTLCHCLPFNTKLSLARHIENHALHYTYPYTCAFCNQELADIKTANQHWRDEHGLLSFHCELCDVEYLYQKSLARHVKDVHGDSKASEHYSCAFCLEEGFETAAAANNHIEQMHNVAADKIDSHMVKRKFRNPDFVRRKPM